MVGILIYVEANERGQCLLGSRDPNFRKPVPRKDSKPVRRQRPCQGGKPQRRVKRVKIKIGRFEIEKGRSFLTFIGVDPVKNGAATVAFRAGYDRDEKGKVVTIIAELDRPRGFRETLLDRLFKGQLCFYQVYAIEPRNKCTCPDGSPCRSTTRKD